MNFQSIKALLIICIIGFFLASCGGEKNVENQENLPPCQDQLAFTASEEETFAGTEITFSNTSKDSTISKILGFGTKAAAEEPAEEEEEEGEEEAEEVSEGPSHHWNFGDGTLDSSDRGMVTHRYDIAGTYTVKLIYKNCGEISKTITIKAIPTPDPVPTVVVPDPNNPAKKIVKKEPCKLKYGKIKASSYKIKVGETVTFEENSGVGYQWAWSGGDNGGPLGKEQKLSYTFTKAGKHKVFCTINNGDKCIVNPSATIMVELPKPVPGAPDLNAAKIGAEFLKLFKDYKKNDKLSPKFKSLCESNQFLISDAIVEFNNEKVSVAEIRNEITSADFIPVSVKVELTPDKKKVSRLIVK